MPEERKKGKWGDYIYCFLNFLITIKENMVTSIKDVIKKKLIIQFRQSMRYKENLMRCGRIKRVLVVQTT